MKIIAGKLQYDPDRETISQPNAKTGYLYIAKRDVSLQDFLAGQESIKIVDSGFSELPPDAPASTTSLYDLRALYVFKTIAASQVKDIKFAKNDLKLHKNVVLHALSFSDSLQTIEGIKVNQDLANRMKANFEKAMSKKAEKVWDNFWAAGADSSAKHGGDEDQINFHKLTSKVLGKQSEWNVMSFDEYVQS